MAAYADGDLGGAVQLGRQAEQIAAGIPGSGVARGVQCNMTELLTEAGDLAAAERVCAAGLAECREAGDEGNLATLLARMTILDLRAGRVEDAAAHLREELQIAMRASSQGDVIEGLEGCGHLILPKLTPCPPFTEVASRQINPSARPR